MRLGLRRRLAYLLLTRPAVLVQSLLTLTTVTFTLTDNTHHDRALCTPIVCRIC